MSLTDNRITDRYPTRTAEPAPHIERTDPTVWGTIETEQLAGFDTDGFTVFDGLLGRDEVVDFAAEVDRLTRDPELVLDERLVIEKGSNQVRSIFEVHQFSSMVADLVRESRIAGLARQILGSEVYIHQSRINYMPGLSGAGFYWHSDFETWHAEDGMPAPRAVSLSIALTENYAFNGSLMLMPGSHRTFVPCQGATPAKHYRESLREQQIGVPSGQDITELAAVRGITQFTGKPGSALLFDSNIMHGSANNITPFARSNIFVVFNSVENTLVEPFAADSPRPTYIADRSFTPLG
ncbi:ectoine hydroxylase [Nocardia huaxiensis]|uniref:ectoine hydroxylase n=1 Tax=Nocardia huaxiensis TaxID=2755382 RepID=UPI001E58B966|nr:ectoine hydroxylase [Nocardia huaxiensis]UFS97080.1 ectoine hydroxylase [Nocardia huaxiensis]